MYDERVKTLGGEDGGMNIAIVDDQQADRKELSQLLDGYLKRRQLQARLTEFSSAQSFLQQFAPGAFQVIFLDIYMPGMNGMDAARRIFEEDPACRLIFCSTSHTHAVESYTVQAAYYLTKPLDSLRMEQAMDVACAALLRDSRSLRVRCAGVEAEVLLRDILFADCSLERARLHLRDRVLAVDGRTTDVFARLTQDERFLNCNRNTAVNMDWVERVLEDDFLLRGGQTVPIRHRGRGALKKAYLQYVLHSLKEEVSP